jgi:hypothetical protein
MVEPRGHGEHEAMSSRVHEAQEALDVFHAELVELSKRLQRLVADIPGADLHLLRESTLDRHRNGTAIEQQVNDVLVHEIDAELERRRV